MYDILIVGAGLSAATICANLKHKYKICVVENRKHIGGNCYDYKTNNTFVHLYGPHIFHTKNKNIFNFLSKFTEWNNFNLKISAEIEFNNTLIKVPFPYSKETENILKVNLNEEEIISLFFKDYSKKMWGMEYDELPISIKKRVPKNTDLKSEYFTNEIQCMPKHGYTRMLENMFDGVDILLNQEEYSWTNIKSKHIIYTGRIDRILSQKCITLAEIYKKILHFRSLKIEHNIEEWNADSHVLNCCHLKNNFTRKTNYGLLHGDSKLNMVSTEYPYQANFDEISPYYPIPSIENLNNYNELLKIIKMKYNNMHFCGRLASYKYLNMDQIVGQALELSTNFL